ncbi:hypothetical protein [Streptomyces sp. NPDC051561]|uniref:hypothetical protein n=1 Tax=Streptomyces sp. NPDC051561 TaxID=3365658 RepID=UPI0037AA5859
MPLRKSMPIAELKKRNDQARAAKGRGEPEPTNGRGRPVPGTPNGTNGRLPRS